MPDDFSELDAELPRVKVKCTDVDCEHNLHCFLQKRKKANLPTYGTCRSCSADLIDWKRLHRRDPDDVEFTFDALKNELIRHHMWTIEFDSEARRKAQMRGRETLYGSVRRRLMSSIGKARGPFDGRQTGMEGEVVFYAQHATATCCRRCLNYWYDIPKDRPLTEEELDFCEALVIRYLDERLPDLQEHQRPELRKRPRS